MLDNTCGTCLRSPYLWTVLKNKLSITFELIIFMEIVHKTIHFIAFASVFSRILVLFVFLKNR